MQSLVRLAELVQLVVCCFEGKKAFLVELVVVVMIGSFVVMMETAE